jgi:hypothetical protein
MPLNFDPNNPAKQKNRPVWATYIPARRGTKFKQHTDRGKALNALGYGNGSGILYHWEPVVDDEGVAEPKWVEVARVEGKPTSCERCGGSFTMDGYGGRTYEAIYHVWIGKPKLRYVTVCRECEYAILFPLKKSVPLEDADKWYSKYNRSAKRKVDQREL